MGDQVLLARAVARADSARPLERDNRAGPRVPIADAVASGKAYFVTPRDDLLVIDVDLPDDPSISADRLAAFDHLLDAAVRAGVPHVALDSGRPGHRHGYLALSPGPARTRLERWAASKGLDVRTRGVRPPGAPHRLTGIPAVGAAHDPAALAAALTRLPDATAATRLAAELCPLVLPPRVMVAVRHGHNHAGYATASHARMALAVATRARGGSLRLVETILMDPTSPLGATFRARPDDWRRTELTRLWDKAGAWISTGGRSDARAHLERVAAAAAAWPWKGAAGGSDVAVLEQLLRTGQRARARTVGLALADLAVGAGVSLDTARAAVRRLTAAGWVHLVARETATTTRTYDLRVPRGAELTDTAAMPPEAGSFGDLGADLARRGGLGKVTVRVARALDVSPGSHTTELGGRLRMTLPAVRYHLRKLARAGLLVARTGGWAVRSSQTAVRAVVRALGVDGVGDRQRAVVAAQRAVRAAARATFARLRRHASRTCGDEPPGPTEL